MDGIFLYLFVLVINPAIHVALLAAGIMLLKQAITMRKIPPNAQIFLVALLAVVVIDLNLFGTSWLRSMFDNNYYTKAKPVVYSHVEEVVPGTPEFAMREITRAIQEQNWELFLRYVDVDGILADVAKKIPEMKTAEVKQQLMEEITSGKAKLSGQNNGPVMFLFGNWIVGGVVADKSAAPAKKSAILPLGVLVPHGVADTAWLNVQVESARTRSDSVVAFKFSKIGSAYKVLADDHTTDKLIKHYRAYDARFRKKLNPKYEPIREEWQRIIQYELKAVRSTFDERHRNGDLKTMIAKCSQNTPRNEREVNGCEDKLQVSVLLKNVHDKAIDSVTFVVIFRESDGERRYWNPGAVLYNQDKKSLPAPGESREIKFELDKQKIAVNHYLLTGAYQMEIFPVEIYFAGGQSIVNNGKPSLEYRQK